MKRMSAHAAHGLPKQHIRLTPAEKMERRKTEIKLEENNEISLQDTVCGCVLVFSVMPMFPYFKAAGTKTI